MNTALQNSAARLRAAIAGASLGLVDREPLVELVALSAVAREHLLVIGPPGTAKSVAVRRIARAAGGRYFEYLLGRFTEPNEIFGPVDLRKLREGVVETDTAGMLPEAEIAFLDEIFHGSSAILNTLLGILNERAFRRGHTNMACPLRICVGASNSLPADESLAAFADRFLVRVFVRSVDDPQLETLLESGWRLDNTALADVATIQDVDALSDAARHVDLRSVQSRLAQLLRVLRGAGIVLSDRRVVKTQSLVAAAAVVGGRSSATFADLWPLIFVVPTEDLQEIARDVLRDLLQETESALFPGAAESASAGPMARARRLAAAASSLLDAAVSDDERPSWKLRLEGVVREVDASFSAENIPAELAAIRARIVSILAPQETVST